MALAERLAGLSLPPAEGAAAPPAEAAAWSATEFAPAGGQCADVPLLSAVAATPGVTVPVGYRVRHPRW